MDNILAMFGKYPVSQKKPHFCFLNCLAEIAPKVKNDDIFEQRIKFSVQNCTRSSVLTSNCYFENSMFLLKFSYWNITI